jgi:hypothetical protein
MSDDYNPTSVGCGALVGERDSIFMFMPSASTTVRVEAKPLTGWLPVLAVFDGPPPVGGVATTAQLFDAATMTLPDTNCLAYSFHDPATGASPAHTYTVCPTRRYGDDANTHCAGADMNYLASIDTAAEPTFLQSTSTPSSYTSVQSPISCTCATPTRSTTAKWLALAPRSTSTSSTTCKPARTTHCCSRVVRPTPMATTTSNCMTN